VLRTIEVPVIPSSVTSFSLATVANYLLSVVLVFERGRFRRSIEILRFLNIVLVGLVLNTFLVWCFVYRFSVHPTAAKIVAVPIVLMWNYLGRRVWLGELEIGGLWTEGRTGVLGPRWFYQRLRR
jgi:putative flippase GtrA